jgi:hypothetical protein
MGNATIAFCTALPVGALFGGGFLAAGAPPTLAIIAFGAVAAFFLVFLFITLNHAAKHPDSAVTSEEYYARVTEARILAGAKDPSIIKEQTPVVGGSSTIVATLLPPEETRDA